MDFYDKLESKKKHYDPVYLGGAPGSAAADLPSV